MNGLIFASASADLENLQKVSGFLGQYYIALAIMNGLAALYVWQQRDNLRLAFYWIGLATFYTILSPLAFSGSPYFVPGVPEFVRDLIDWATGPVVYSGGSLLLLIALFLGRRFFVKPVVAWIGLNLALLVLGLSIVDQDFARIVTKPDNVPIVGMMFLLAFFTWLAAAQAVANDQRRREGLPPLEKENDEKVLVWPDLVYTEMICMIAFTAFLIIWAILLKAPLEEPASAVKTPNPSKAPWYFLGLQEMLVYFDPWYAGVVMPLTVIMGLMAIPYLDFNKGGNGYYTIDERKFAYLTFQFGFIVLWITLIVLGTFLRGPNWNFFGPYERWDAHKVVTMNNRDVSEIFWSDMMATSRPKAPPDSDAFTELGYIVYREWLGIALLLGYFMVLPPLMAATVFRKYFVKMGFVRYMTMANLFLMMSTMPIKMVLRWTLNLKYVVSIPEYFLNF
jgi:hypothetical protein